MIRLSDTTPAGACPATSEIPGFLAEARRCVEGGRFEEALAHLDRAPPPGPCRDGSRREIRLECCIGLRRWDEGAALADALLHERLKIPAVARFHCAVARQCLEAGDRSRALWEIGIALQTDDCIGPVILADKTLGAIFRR